TGRGDNTLLSLSPVIVRGNDGTVTVVKLQHRIRQWVGNAKTCQCRSEGAHKYPLVVELHDHSCDHHVIPCLHESASRNVTKLCVGDGSIADFNEGDTGAVLIPHEKCRV